MLLALLIALIAASNAPAVRPPPVAGEARSASNAPAVRPPPVAGEARSSGWEGKVHFTHDPPRKSGGSEGAIHVSGRRVRVEEPTPIGLTVILSADGKVRLLFPERRQLMEIDAEQAALATVPPLSLKGLQRAGAESVDGRACTIWERALTTKVGRVRQRIWVPDGAPRFVFLRFVTQTERGATRADVSEVREGAQAEALFRVPRDYEKK
jgi:hypothetical protein